MLVLQFSRTVAPLTNRGPALIALMGLNNWKKVVMITSAESIWFKTGIELTRQLDNAGTEVLKLAAFEPGNFRPSMLSQIKRSGIRIVVVMGYGVNLQKVALGADIQEMSMGHAWICMELMTQATEQMQGWLYVRPFLPQGMQGFAEQVSNYTKARFNIVPSPDLVGNNLAYSMTLHDAIVLYAHAATKVLLEGGDLQNGTAVTEAVRSTTFEGVGGSTVVLDKKGDRTGDSYEVMNIMVDVECRTSSVPVGLYNSTLQQYKAYERAVVWPGKTMEVPVDYFSGEP